MDATSVFLSYAQPDRTFALELAKSMREKGIVVFDPVLTVSSGEVWAKAIQNAIQQSNAVIVVLPSSGARGSNNAFFEIGLGRAMNKKVLAITPDRMSTGDRQLPSDLLDLLVLDGANKSTKVIADTLSQALKAA